MNHPDEVLGRKFSCDNPENPLDEGTWVEESCPACMIAIEAFLHNNPDWLMWNPAAHRLLDADGFLRAYNLRPL